MPYKDPEVRKQKARERQILRANELSIYNKEYQAVYNRLPEVIQRNRLKHVKRTYGLDGDEYLQMVLDQNNACAICSKIETATNRHGDVRPLCVDHDHATGKVRALLCNQCNSMLGHIDDSITLLEKGIQYLLKYKE